VGLWNALKTQVKDNYNKQAEELAQKATRKKEMDDQGIPYCPKCLSTSLSANKKGFGVGKALVGGALTGGVGLLAGAIGKNKMELYCMKCGNKFRP